MKLLKTICVLGIALCLVTSVYAGTQSVKISGDITIRSLFRKDFDQNQNHSETESYFLNMPGGDPTGNPQMYVYPGSNDWANYFMTTTEVQIDADLTDNVSAVIRLLNQRDWNGEARYGTCTESQPITVGSESYYRLKAAGLVNDDEFDIILDLAYVELKEFLYSPLTLKVGRQDLWFGKGFIVGANRQNPGNTISAPEYTAVTSFDAIRATLDYDPWTIDAIAAKIHEGHISSEDDETLFGVNVGYIFDVYNAEAETYWFWKNDANSVQPNRIKEHNTIHTIGLRGSADPIENWTVAAETAYQFGDYVGMVNQRNDRNRSAWALDVSAECRYFKETYAWKPVLGLEYIFYSGDNTTSPDNEYRTGTYKGWDAMYRGKYDSAIREWYGRYYWSTQGLDTIRYLNQQDPINQEDSSTNQHQLIVMGSVQPTDSLSVDARYLAFWLVEDRGWIIPNAVPTHVVEERGNFAGSEVDLELTWDYTEDVSFGLLTAWFFPGEVYADGSDDTITDVVATMKLSF